MRPCDPVAAQALIDGRIYPNHGCKNRALLQRDGKSASDKIRLQILLFIRISDKTHCRTMFFKARKVSQLPSSRTLANAAMIDYIRPVYQVEERIKALREEYAAR